MGGRGGGGGGRGGGGGGGAAGGTATQPAPVNASFRGIISDLDMAKQLRTSRAVDPQAPPVPGVRSVTLSGTTVGFVAPNREPVMGGGTRGLRYQVGTRAAGYRAYDQGGRFLGTSGNLDGAKFRIASNVTGNERLENTARGRR